ncbi:MAG: ATPase [Chloroflexi bacterium 44-23]|nr:MAG: ATPase [Chloroflexi bacterium 44-23]
MKRLILEKLIAWKDDPYRKPLIIRGARQVGKTWIMKQFGALYFEKVAYLNFDNNTRMVNLYEHDFDLQRILTGLQIEAGVPIDSETLIIFDEIQNVPNAINSLKYFFEQLPDYHILAAGSLLGVALHPASSFPVGSVQFLDLYPLNFSEFLSATGNDDLLSLLYQQDFELITAFKSKYIDLLKKYYFCGGMPEVVKTYTLTNDFMKVRQVQSQLLQAYIQDFSKHAPLEIVPRIRLLWNSIPAQLSKENRKFVYGLIKQGARARDFELALQWLLDSGLIYQVLRISKPNIPLSAYIDGNSFKLFFLDIGLLCALSELDLKTLLEGSRIFEEFKGSLTEQFVFQELLASREINPFYWSAENGTAEVDFVFQYNGEIIPLEVKAAENLQSKSLRSFSEKYQPSRVFRISLSDFRKGEHVHNIPLYATPILVELLDK